MTPEELLLAIYNAYESMRYYEHQHKTELPDVRQPLEGVLEKLALEEIAWLHEHSIAPALSLIEECRTDKLNYESYHDQRVRRSQR